MGKTHTQKKKCMMMVLEILINKGESNLTLFMCSVTEQLMLFCVYFVLN